VNRDEVLAVADRVLERARPGEELEAVVTWSRDTEVRAHDGEIEHVVGAESTGVGVRMIVDGRQGMAWAGVLDDDALDDCVASARDNASFATPDEYAGLARPDGVVAPDLDLYDDRLPATGMEERLALALELERLVRDGDPRMLGTESADYADTVTTGAIVTTTGIRVAGSETSAYVGAYALAGDDEDTTTGFGWSVARWAGGLDVEAAAAEAVRRSTELLGARKARSRRVTVVLDPSVTSQLLGVLGEMLSGEAVLRGRSPFADRVGEPIAAPLLTLVDDPLDLAAPTASDVDGEGLACRPVTLVEGGVLRAFLHNAYTGRAMGAPSTGSAVRGSHRSVPGVGPRALRPTPGNRSAPAVLADVGDALLVREVSGLHSGINPVSGDVSVGVDGLMVRGGAPAEPVREVTIASTLQRLLTDVVAVGDDLTYFPWEAAGVTLAVADVTMSGT
jgi:PmbA protein